MRAAGKKPFAPSLSKGSSRSQRAARASFDRLRMIGGSARTGFCRRVTMQEAVRPELVEGLVPKSARHEGFDRLSPNGICRRVTMQEAVRPELVEGLVPKSARYEGFLRQAQDDRRLSPNGIRPARDDARSRSP